MANICPQSGLTSVLINTSLQKGTTLAGSLVAKGKRIYMEQKEKRNLRFTVALPLIFPCVIMIIFCSNYLTEGAHSL